MEGLKNDKKIVVKMEKTDEGSYEGEDDDCYVIDPIDFTRKLALGDPSDDVVLVADKGPIALRDYPHPRYLCANFPFDSTAHRDYCDQCFCAVCDVRAPCLLWGLEDHASVARKKTKIQFFIY